MKRKRISKENVGADCADSSTRSPSTEKGACNQDVQGDYVKIMKGTFKEFFGVALGDSYGDEVEINYFKEMHGKPYGRYWVLEPNDKDSRTNDEVQKVEPNLIDGRGRFVF